MDGTQAGNARWVIFRIATPPTQRFALGDAETTSHERSLSTKWVGEVREDN